MKTPQGVPNMTTQTTPEISVSDTMFCAICQSQVTKAHKDDTNTQFYDCPKCGFVTKVKEPKDLEILGISLVPLPETEESKAAKEAWKKEIAETTAKINEFDKQIKTIETEIGTIDWTYVNLITEDEPFNVSEFVNTLLARREYHIVTDKNSQVIYLYTERTGVYHKDGEQYLRHIIDNVLGQHSTSHKINEAIELIKIRTYASITHSKKIAVQNGLLDIQTGKTEPFTPYEFNTAKLNVSYKEGAVCADWLEFVNQVCPADKELLQEWSGYLLIKGYPYHAIMWFFGPKGRNGKGVWARTMESILGEENYSAEPLEKLDGAHKFAVFNLHDSLLNICNEPKADRYLTIEQLQSLSGQDTLDAERKGVQEPFKLKNSAKITVMGNKFPTVNNPTDAFWERLKLIKFPFRFIGINQIPDIEKNWLEEPDKRSGILNWMIEGALRLSSNLGRFTETKTQRETIIQFKRASDNIGSFIDECLELNVKETASKAATQEHYKSYCATIGSQPKSPTNLNDRLETLINVKATSTYEGIGKDKRKVKVWKGFKLLELPEEPEDKEEQEADQETEEKQTTLAQPGTAGTSGTSFMEYSNTEKIQSEKNNKDAQKAVLSVLSVPNLKNSAVSETEHTDQKNSGLAKDCVNHKKPSCSYPSGNFESLEDDHYCGNMPCFKLKTVQAEAELPKPKQPALSNVEQENDDRNYDNDGEGF